MIFGNPRIFMTLATATMSNLPPIQVGLLGIGTVGSGVFRVLQRNQ